MCFVQICTFVKGTTVEMIADQMVPYAYRGNEWVGFDSRQSFETKVISPISLHNIVI